jgi:hypothetical protein
VSKYPLPYVNPYESYYQDDAVPPPPPPSDEHEIVAEEITRKEMPDLDHWIEYSKRIGVAESMEAFQTMQQLTSTTYRVPTPASYAVPSLATTTAVAPSSSSMPVMMEGNKKNTSIGGPAQEAIREINSLAHHQTMSSMPTPAFTGTSPTDLLFMYHNVAHNNSHPNEVTPIQGNGEGDDDLALSPHAAAELAARTYDLYSDKLSYNNGRGITNPHMSHSSSTIKQQHHKSHYVAAAAAGAPEEVSSSYDAMIDRLSYNLTNGLKATHSNTHHAPVNNPIPSASAVTSTKGKSTAAAMYVNEEQPSMIDPKSHAPTPQTAPLHPLKSRITAADYVHTKMESDVFDTRKQLFDVSPEFLREKRIYDATNGCF